MEASNSTDEVAIQIEDLSKTFRLPHEKTDSIKSAIINFYRKSRTYEVQQALKNISFDIHKGEFFGIVGRNGSGKSTLLKLIAGIYSPTSGRVFVDGQLTPFIEFGVGFNPELTGRENVFLNGALLGFSRKEMNKLYPHIVSFAEIERFMDQKLKNYSSGMQVRLAFSIAIQAKNDILLIDEVLAVGDLDFQKKCYNYFYDLKKQGQTVILVTHDMGAVRKFCTRGALIHDSKLKHIGTAEEIAYLYESINLRSAEKRLQEENKKEVEIPRRDGNRDAIITSAQTFNTKTSESQATFSPEEKIGVRIEYEAHAKIDKPSVSFILQDQEDVTVFAMNNWLKKISIKDINPGDRITMETVIDNVFTDGEFTITAAIESEDFLTVYDRIKYMHKFMIGGNKLPHAKTHPQYEVKIIYAHKDPA